MMQQHCSHRCMSSINALRLLASTQTIRTNVAFSTHASRISQLLSARAFPVRGMKSIIIPKSHVPDGHTLTQMTLDGLQHTSTIVADDQDVDSMPPQDSSSSSPVLNALHIQQSSHMAARKVTSASSIASALSDSYTPQDFIAAVPPIQVQGLTAVCDGGDGSRGHPIEYITLNKIDPTKPATCKYCGLKFISAGAGHHH